MEGDGLHVGRHAAVIATGDDHAVGVRLAVVELACEVALFCEVVSLAAIDNLQQVGSGLLGVAVVGA